MRVNLDTLNEPVWVDWKDGVRVLLQPLPASKNRELKNKATRRKVDFSTGRKQRVETVDDDKYNRLLEEHILLDWENISDQTGAPLPCNDRTKRALLDHFHEFRFFVISTAQELENYQQEKTEEEEKNFSG